MSLAPETRRFKGYARSAGFLYLGIIVAGVFAEFIVRASLIAPGDAAATGENVRADEFLYRLGLLGDLAMVAFDVAIAFAFYLLLKPVSRNGALLAMLFRLMQAAFLGLKLLMHVAAGVALTGGERFAALGQAQLDALALLFLEVHAYAYDMAMVFFGLHLVLLGCLLVKADYVPSVLGRLAGFAGLVYVGDAAISWLYPVHDAFMANVVLPVAFIAELALGAWLLVRGVHAQGSHHLANADTA